MNTTTTEISDEARPLTSGELDAVSGGFMQVTFSFGCLSYVITASETQYSVVRFDSCLPPT
jgi:hypothetical protein